MQTGQLTLQMDNVFHASAQAGDACSCRLQYLIAVQQIHKRVYLGLIAGEFDDQAVLGYIDDFGAEDIRHRYDALALLGGSLDLNKRQLDSGAGKMQRE